MVTVGTYGGPRAMLNFQGAMLKVPGLFVVCVFFFMSGKSCLSTTFLTHRLRNGVKWNGLKMFFK